MYASAQSGSTDFKLNIMVSSLERHPIGEERKEMENKAH